MAYSLRNSRSAQPLLRLADMFADWRDRAASRRALLRLSPHELDDIGLAPGDIDAVSRIRRL